MDKLPQYKKKGVLWSTQEEKLLNGDDSKQDGRYASFAATRIEDGFHRSSSNSSLEISNSSSDHDIYNEYRRVGMSSSMSEWRPLGDASTKSARVVNFDTHLDDNKRKVRSHPHKRGNDTDASKSNHTKKHHQHHQHVHLHHHQDEDSFLSLSTASSQKGNSIENENWMTRIAYAFRTPLHERHKKEPHHRRDSSGLVLEYPHSIFNNKRESTTPSYCHNFDMVDDEEELQPMLSSGGRMSSLTVSSPPPPPPPPIHGKVNGLAASKEKDGTYQEAAANRCVAIAAAFLQDYESNRPPSLSFQISEHTDWELKWHQFKFGSWFNSLLILATVALFISSLLEGGPHRCLLSGLNFFAVAVFGVDLWIRFQLRKGDGDLTYQSHHETATQQDSSRQVESSTANYQDSQRGHHHNLASDSLHHHDPRQRSSRSGKLVKPLILFGVVLCYENFLRLFMTDTIVLCSSFFKPLVLYYVSYQARDALEAVRRIIKTVARVIVMELLLILMFAAVAVRLFGTFEQFHNLSTAWLSLFELSTTVVNPSIWMPMYEHSGYSAIFFITFIVTSVFYLHSLVLSVVFQTYVHAATTIHERSVADRENSVHLAYIALKRESQEKDGVDVELVRRTLQTLRPHYGPMKISALVDIVDPTNQKFVDYPTFRTKIRQALNASIRTTRSSSTVAMCVEILAVVLAIVNFVYVILVSSDFDHEWFNNIQEGVGILITLLAGVELLVRFNPLGIAQFTPLTRLNPTFDGLALVAALASSGGIVLRITGHPSSLDLVLMGRAIDMIRVMRFFSIFRDVVRRSTDVLPALIGPIVLLITTLHAFAYSGIALWGGSIHVGSYGENITPHYDLNNFNSYQKGLVTMFQIIVVNDWHAIAEVFTYADRCSSPYIVYPFFVLSNLVGVSIMLNVLTAFFVETFVTNIDSEDDPTNNTNNRQPSHKSKSVDMSIRTSENSPIKRLTSSSNLRYDSDTLRGSLGDTGSDANSYASADLVEFDVYEREGFDKIMQTVTGVAGHSTDIARDLSKYLEIYEHLSPGREKVGYLVCDQQTLDR